MKTSSKFRGTGNPDTEYPMTYPIRGHMLIIDIEEFPGYPKLKREGSRMDSLAMEQVFSEIGFKVGL